MTDGTYEKGLTGERKAVEYLTKKGMVLLSQRYHSPFGEIDLVMRDGDTLAFVEVKARDTGREGSGLISITMRKQAKIIKTALQYMTENNCDCAARFDVIELTKDGIQYIMDAFVGKEF